MVRTCALWVALGLMGTACAGGGGKSSIGAGDPIDPAPTLDEQVDEVAETPPEPEPEPPPSPAEPPPEPEPEPPPVFVASMQPVAVETQAPIEVSAGQSIEVVCTVIDDAGEATEATDYDVTVRVAPAGSVEGFGTSLTAVRAGTIEVSCGIDELRLVDDSPARVDIVPGAAAFIQTSLDRSNLTAGESANATCEVFDAYENPITDATPQLNVEPSDGANAVAGLEATFTRAGIYTARCDLPGAEASSARLEVRPGLPNKLAVTPVPAEPVYGIGEVVEVVSVVTDQYGNPIPYAEVTLGGDDAVTPQGVRRVRLNDEGTLTVTARVEGDTYEDIELTADLILVVNGRGPTIRCGDGSGTGIRDGAMVNAAPGSELLFTGSVSDANDVSEVTVNGVAATLDDAGAFAVPITTRFGINVVDIVARDGFGVENSRLCALLVNDRWAAEDALLNNAIALVLSQDAVDDGVRNDGLDSLNDLLFQAINSGGLRDALHDALLDANPLKPRSCDQRVLGVCVLRSQIDYRDSRLDGPNSTSLTLIDGGLRARIRLENVAVRLKVSGTLDSTGWVDFDWIEIDADFNTTLSGGRPRITVRNDSVAVRVGGIDTDFGGLSGFILDIVLSLAEGRVRGLVVDLLRDWVRDNFNEILDGVVSGLDINTLGSTFEVPRLDGGEPIALGFGLGFSALDTNAQRLRFGIGTRFDAPTQVAFPSLGAALPAGPVLDNPAGPGTARLSVFSGLFNQVLHALWRAGLLEADLGGAALGGGDLPDGLSIQLSAALPPVAELRGDGTAELGLGALQLSLVYPGLFDEPIELWLAARAVTEVTLVGNDLSFGQLEIETLHFSTQQASLDSDTRAVVEGVMLALVQQVVGSALNDALPALPIPSFTLPGSLSDFGLPPGAELGLQSMVLNVESPHFVLRGDFGAQ